MTKAELIAALIGAAIIIIPTVALFVVGRFKRLNKEDELRVKEIELKELEVEAKALEVKRSRQSLSESIATQAMNYARETGALEGTKGSERAELANKIYVEKMPNATPAEAEFAVRAAVGATPGVGESAKEEAKKKVNGR